jgi:hypothetical protein
MPLSVKEVGAIEEAIKAENLAAKKLEVVRDQIRDPELRRIAEDLLHDFHRNVDRMLNELRA